MGVTGLTRSALRQHLDNVPSAPPSNQRAWELEMFTPTIGTAWIRESFKPFNASLESMPARGGLVEHDALWLIDLMVPAREGTTVADDTADAIVAGYWPGQYLNYNAQPVEIVRSRHVGAMPDEDPNWAMVPIEITVRAKTFNPS